MKSLRIVFMGTPEFAVSALGALLINGFNVVAVVTAPDKPAGRGQKISRPAIKEFAEYSSLPILQPTNLKDPDFIRQLADLNADIFIVVAFRMLPAAVWKLPAIGTINLHASLLPQYRGSAPINHAIINGETVTGLTTFFIDDKIDTGSVLMQEQLSIFSFENAGDLHDRMKKHGARLIIKTLQGIAGKSIQPVSQAGLVKPGEVLRTAPKITPEFCFIDWNNTTKSINNFIRGLSPYPCARTILERDNQKLMLKIFESYADNTAHNFRPGTIISDGKSSLRIACADGFLGICSLQPEGRKRMNSDEFLRGYKTDGLSVALRTPAS